jgi:hypothetical protein
MSVTLHKSIFDKWDYSYTQYNRKNAEAWVTKGPVQETAEALLSWAKDHPFLRVVQCTIPNGIFPDGVTVILNDIQVTTPRRKRGPRIVDDDVYDAFPLVRKYAPRGSCILQLNSPENQTSKIVVFALKKFTGGPGDDDDLATALEEEAEHADKNLEDDTQRARQRWEHYFVENPNRAQYIIRTSKENGEAAHLGQFRYLGEIYYIFGSKNVHLILKNPSDIEKYHEARFLTATMIAKAMIDRVMNNNDTNMQKFMDYMEEKDVCACFEFLNVDYQHVEVFDFEKSKYRFITFTSNKNLQQLCTDSFEDSVKIARDAGFETIVVTKYPANQQNQIYDDIRSEYGKEGSVLYYFNDADKCIGMMKKKSVWYVVVRAIREKIRGIAPRIAEGGVDQERMAKLRKRLRQTIRQKQEWLGFDDEAKQKWINLAEAFSEWIHDCITNKKLDTHRVHTQFPAVWSQFLKEKNLDDNVKVVIDPNRIGKKSEPTEDDLEDEKVKVNRGGRYHGKGRGARNNAPTANNIERQEDVVVQSENINSPEQQKTKKKTQGDDNQSNQVLPSELTEQVQPNPQSTDKVRNSGGGRGRGRGRGVLGKGNESRSQQNAINK